MSSRRYLYHVPACPCPIYSPPLAVRDRRHRVQHPHQPNRTRRPTAKPAEAEVVSLMQVETTAPVTEPLSSATPAPLHPTRRRPRPQVAETQELLVQVETQSPQ